MAGHRKRARKQGAGGTSARNQDGRIAVRPQDVSAADTRLARNAKAVRKRQRYSEDPEYRERTLAYNRRWWAAHKGEINERNRRRYATDPEYSRRRRLGSTEHGYRYQLKALYGLSMSDYRAMSAQQDGRCAICRAKPVSRKLGVDHDDRTGLIRGLLCSLCNLGLGYFDHSRERLRTAMGYLEAAMARHRAADQTGVRRVPAGLPPSRKRRPALETPDRSVPRRSTVPPCKPGLDGSHRPRPRRG
jgi:hypothetical protein